MRPRPSSAVGKPFVSCFQVLPPSVELKRPLPAAMNDSPLRISHGATRAAHSAAQMVCEFAGSNTRSAPPGLSSLYKTFLNESPPSVQRDTPHTALAP